MYLSAGNADELGDALRRTVQAAPITPDAADFSDPVATARNVRFEFCDTPDGPQIDIRELTGSVMHADLSVTLAGAQAGSAPVMQAQSVQADPAPTSPAASDTAHVFVDQSGAPLLEILEPQGDAETATIVLSPAWCGFVDCKAARISVPSKRVEVVFENAVGSTSFRAESYSFELNSYGETKHIIVTGGGADKVRLDFFDRVMLGATPTAAKSGEALTFTARALRNNHFEMMEAGKPTATIAAACFFSGGEVDANAIMPNGQPLATLIATRDDGAPAGFGYGADNGVVQQ